MNKRQRKKKAKKAAERQRQIHLGFQEIGHIFADEILYQMGKPSMFCSKEEWITWDNTQHPWWVRTDTDRLFLEEYTA